jgi:hypothetical protein
MKFGEIASLSSPFLHYMSRTSFYLVDMERNLASLKITAEGWGANVLVIELS